MAPTLYMIEESPPVRSVLMCAKAIGLDLKRQIVNTLKQEQYKPEFLKINPQHTVPTLVDNDGFVIWDSHAIMGYLVNKYGKDKSLYPEDYKKRAIVDQRLHFDSNVLFIRGLMIIKSMFSEGVSQITEQQQQPIIEAFEFVEKFLENKKWIAGDELTIADFSFAGTISTWTVIESIDDTKYPRISAWLKQVEKQPWYEVNKQGLTAFKTLFKSKLAK